MRLAALAAVGPAAVNRYLLPHEIQVTSTRQHPALLIGPSVLALSGLLAAVVLSATVLHGKTELILAVWATWLILLLRVIWKAVNWMVDFLVVTSDRILMTSGALSRKVAIIPLSTVNDLSFQRSFGGRLFGYGEFLVTSQAPNQIVQKIEYLPYPEELYLRIIHVLFPAAEVSCPLCDGEGRVLQRPDDEAETTIETRKYRSADERRETRDDLLAQGYLEIICPECGGKGTVAAEDGQGASDAF